MHLKITTQLNSFQTATVPFLISSFMLKPCLLLIVAWWFSSWGLSWLQMFHNVQAQTSKHDIFINYDRNVIFVYRYYNGRYYWDPISLKLRYRKYILQQMYEICFKTNLHSMCAFLSEPAFTSVLLPAYIHVTCSCGLVEHVPHANIHVGQHTHCLMFLLIYRLSQNIVHIRLQKPVFQTDAPRTEVCV